MLEPYRKFARAGKRGKWESSRNLTEKPRNGDIDADREYDSISEEITSRKRERRIQTLTPSPLGARVGERGKGLPSQRAYGFGRVVFPLTPQPLSPRGEGSKKFETTGKYHRALGRSGHLPDGRVTSDSSRWMLSTLPTMRSYRSV